MTWWLTLLNVCWIHPEAEKIQSRTRQHEGGLSQLELSSIFYFQLCSCHLYTNAPFSEFCSTVPADFVFSLPPHKKGTKKCDLDDLTAGTTEGYAADGRCRNYLWHVNLYIVVFPLKKHHCYTSQCSSGIVGDSVFTSKSTKVSTFNPVNLTTQPRPVAIAPAGGRRARLSC